MDIRGIPIGFGFALAMEPDALRNFATLPQDQRSAVIQRARLTASKEEMHKILDDLASGRSIQ